MHGKYQTVTGGILRNLNFDFNIYLRNFRFMRSRSKIELKNLQNFNHAMIMNHAKVRIKMFLTLINAQTWIFLG